MGGCAIARERGGASERLATHIEVGVQVPAEGARAHYMNDATTVARGQVYAPLSSDILLDE